MDLSLDCSSKCLAQFHALLWILLMWFPFITTWFALSDKIYDFNQLTWWSWLVQTIFYTNMYLKTALLLHHPRRMIYKCCKRSKNTKEIHPWVSKIDFFFLGIVSGISWFVFFMFGYVLYHNPSVVHQAAQNSTNGAITQLGNIMVHYYTVSALFIWTVFNQKHIRKTIKTALRDWQICNTILFSFLWLVILFGYISYWKFQINNICKNYWIDDVPIEYSIIFGVIFIGLVSSINFIYVFAI